MRKPTGNLEPKRSFSEELVIVDYKKNWMEKEYGCYRGFGECVLNCEAK